MAEPIYYHALGLPYPPPANLNLKLNLLTPHHSTHTTTEVGPLPAEQITSRALPLKFTYLLILMIGTTTGIYLHLPVPERIDGQTQ
jgi:hypothetical protein